ncbi:MAG: glycosyltransferase family 4 protein [Verrucomicrobiaceae bacterium]|nr:glycosyltransferase family 4 protein [Verrucomicrobiaceae bacterium]
MRPRLLFISNLFPDASEPYRGLDNVTLLHLLRGHWDVRVVALRPSLKSWIGGTPTWKAREEDAVLKPLFLPVRYVPKIGGLFNHKLILSALNKALPAIGQEFTYDIVLASWLFPDGWAAIKAAKKPCVLIAQGSDVHGYLRSAPRKKAILEAIDKSCGVITRSRSLATLLARAGAEATRLHPIHNGVDVSVFQPGERVLKPEKMVLFVGNLLPVKNPELLLRAFARLTTPARLVIAGKGPLRQSLEALATTLGIAERVQFLGPQLAPQIAEQMRSSDVLCMSSLNEGLPNVVIEAMASGLPVIATDVGGIHEVIDAPWKGTLVPSGDESALAKALNDVLANPLDRERIGAYGQGLSWQRTAQGYEEVLRQAMCGRLSTLP